MVASLREEGPFKRLSYYLDTQAQGLGEYLLQGFLTTILGGVPGLAGIAFRGLAYRLMLRVEGLVAIECNVRLRHSRNIRLGAGVFLDQGTYLHACPQGIEIGPESCIMHNAELNVFNFRDLPHAFIRVGKGTFIGESVVIRGQGGVTIGDYVLIAPQAKILAVNHCFLDVTRPVLDQGITGEGVVIEDGAWIGAGAAILDGVRVGRGAVVGANAVVTRDVPPHTVAVGAPAKVIRRIADRPTRSATNDSDLLTIIGATSASVSGRAGVLSEIASRDPAMQAFSGDRSALERTDQQ